MKFCVYDIEVLPNCFILCYRISEGDTQTIEISSRKFELKQLKELFERDLLFTGYNCIHYDTPICNMLLDKYHDFVYNRNYLEVTDAAYKLSNLIVNSETSANWKQYKYGKHFKQLDLMTMMASKALRVGLKSLQITMCYENVKEMQIKWSEYIKPGDIDSLIHYCHNDVGSTYELLRLLIDEIKLRIEIKKTFGIECLSKDGVGIGVDIFTKYICEELGLVNPSDLQYYVDRMESIPVKDLIVPVIKFKTPVLQEVLNWFQDLTLNRDGLGNDGKSPTKTVRINKLEHSLGLGGIHSVNKPAIYVADDEWLYIDADVKVAAS